MENPGSDAGQDPGAQHEQFGSFRGVGGIDAYCGNLPSSSAACVPGLLRLSQATSASGVAVPTYSEMHSADPLQNIGDAQAQSLHQHQHQHDYDQHGELLGKAHHVASFSDARHNEMTSDEDGSMSGKFSLPQALSSPSQSGQPAAGLSPQTAKKTKGRVKIKMEYIDNKLRRYTTFSKRKTGIMKKAYELSTLTGTQVMLLVASETGHVYTFATRKLQPMITSEAGKALIQTCLNSPDPAGAPPGPGDQRMSATGFEETELCCGAEDEQKEEADSDCDSSPGGGAPDLTQGGTGTEAEHTTCATTAAAAPSTAAEHIDWSSPLQTASHSQSLPEGLVLLNSPTSVIRRVASEIAGEPPCASEPTDLSKSRVTLIGTPTTGPPGRA
ncbi:serum response factor homolog [Amphibalanus amphitrite]|uniref:serum response factor homolog n=1 Tax=Amphibalanus amphitrite TaxID=1232801 RepID=UPI001C918DE5|nr:serum response factor homolog [Amphibalanus amphitrite]XP_043206827.1 serum response factor homolog [Amphibalanus amphitrite]